MNVVKRFIISQKIERFVLLQTASFRKPDKCMLVQQSQRLISNVTVLHFSINSRQSIFKLGKSYIAFNNCISNQKHNILLSFSPMYELKRNLLILKFYIFDLDLFKFRQKYITVMVKCIFVMFCDQQTLYDKNKVKQDTCFLLFILFRKKICTHFS